MEDQIAITAAEMLAAKQYADSKFYEPFDALTRSGKQVWYAYYNGFLTGIKQSDTPSLPKVTRVEVIDEKGRSYVNWDNCNVVKAELQDSKKTLKVFISKNTATGKAAE